MTCVEVRSLLAERSLGTLEAEAATGLDRHLARCAACRKEGGELDAAAGSLAYVLAPAAPPSGLEDRVVTTVQRVAAGRVPARRRGRMSMVVATAVAAMVAVAGLGFGAVMAGRAARFRDQAVTSSVRNRDSMDIFRWILRSMEFSDPSNSVEMGTLAPVGGGPASGSALTLLAPRSPDMAIVTLAALRVDLSRLPLEVSLVGPGRKVVVGSISRLDSGGAASVGTSLNEDLSMFEEVVVRDAKGIVLLRGDLRARSLQSASPAS